MPINRQVGYDEQTIYSTAELSAMYVDEGKPPALALSMAQSLKRAMETMNRAERRLWKKVRDHEVRAGLLRTIEELEEAYKEDSDAFQERSTEEEVLRNGSPGGTEEGNHGGVGSSNPEREEASGACPAKEEE
jgi:hypothetical protein